MAGLGGSSQTTRTPVCGIHSNDNRPRNGNGLQVECLHYYYYFLQFLFLLYMIFYSCISGQKQKWQPRPRAEWKGVATRSWIILLPLVSCLLSVACWLLSVVCCQCCRWQNVSELLNWHVTYAETTSKYLSKSPSLSLSSLLSCLYSLRFLALIFILLF